MLLRNDASYVLVIPLLLLIVYIIFRHRSRLFEKLEKILILPILEDGGDDRQTLLSDSGDYIPCPVSVSITTV